MSNKVYSLFGQLDNSEYINLTDEEKFNLDYINKCLYSDNKNISNASFKIMMLLLELKEDPYKYEPEEISEKKDEIFKYLSQQETSDMNKFMLSCIYSMGIYSEESKKERKLNRKKGYDLNVKS